MTNTTKQEEILNKINKIHNTTYSEDPAIQLNQENYRIKELINQKVLEAIAEIKSSEPLFGELHFSHVCNQSNADCMRFEGRNQMRHSVLSAIEQVEKRYKGE